MRNPIAICLFAATAAACSSQSGNNAAGNGANAAPANIAAPAPAPNTANTGDDGDANLAENAAGVGTVSIYSAGGSEPGWALNISRGVIAYSSQNGPNLTVPAPAPQTIPNGIKYVTPQLTVTITHTPCEAVDNHTYSDTVQVAVAGQTLNGCGGQ